MISFSELCRLRQSCRRFKTDPVERVLIDRCLDAARLAPSACNSQPWSFLVVDQEPWRSRLADAAFSVISSMNKFAKDAPVLIVVLTERSRYMARLGGQFRGVQYSLIDIGIAGAHLDLAACEAGLGSCWLGWLNARAVRKVLCLPKASRIDLMFALGYPADSRVRVKGRKSLAEIRRYAGAE